MVTVTNFAIRKTNDDRTFVALELTGGVGIPSVSFVRHCDKNSVAEKRGILLPPFYSSQSRYSC